MPIIAALARTINFFTVCFPRPLRAHSDACRRQVESRQFVAGSTNRTKSRTMINNSSMVLSFITGSRYRIFGKRAEDMSNKWALKESLQEDKKYEKIRVILLELNY